MNGEDWNDALVMIEDAKKLYEYSQNCRFDPLRTCKRYGKKLFLAILSGLNSAKTG